MVPARARLPSPTRNGRACHWLGRARGGLLVPRGYRALLRWRFQHVRVSDRHSPSCESSNRRRTCSIRKLKIISYMPTKSAKSKLLKSSQRSNKNAEGKFGLSKRNATAWAVEGSLGVFCVCVATKHTHHLPVDGRRAACHRRRRRAAPKLAAILLGLGQTLGLGFGLRGIADGLCQHLA